MRTALCLLPLLALFFVARATITIVDPAFAAKSILPWIWAPITFTNDGTLWLIDQSDGCLYYINNVSGNPHPSQTPILASTTCLNAVVNGGGAWDWGLAATASGRLFTANGWEITSLKNGGHSPTLLFGQGVLEGNVRGIVVDPTNGDLVIGGYPVGKVFRVSNPDQNAHPTTTVLNTDTSQGGIDGISVGPDGTIYASGYDTAELLVFSPTGTLLNAVKTADLPLSSYGPDGAAVASDGTYVVTSRANAHEFTKWDLTSTPKYKQSTIVRTTSYGDWSTVGPDGCMYITSLTGDDGIVRLTNADGTCSFSAPTMTTCLPVAVAESTGDASYSASISTGKHMCFPECSS